MLDLEKICRKIGKALGVPVVINLSDDEQSPMVAIIHDRGKRFTQFLGTPSQHKLNLQRLHEAVYHDRGRQKFEEQGGLCALCGKPMRGTEYTEIDHIKSRGSNGRDDTMTNLRVVDTACHEQRHRGFKKDMSQLILRGVTIVNVTLAASSPKREIEIKCRATWSDTVCKQMEWTEEPKGFGNGGLEGKLFGVNMILEPNKKELKDFRFDIPISLVSKFRHIAKSEDGEVTNRELEFVVTSVDDEAPLVLDNFLKHVSVSDDAGQCKITYSAEVQETLGEGGQPADKDQPTLGEGGEPAPTEIDKPRGRRKSAAASEAVQ